MGETNVVIGITFLTIFVVFMFSNVVTDPTTSQNLDIKCKMELGAIQQAPMAIEKELSKISERLNELQNPTNTTRTPEEQEEYEKLGWLGKVMADTGKGVSDFAGGIAGTIESAYLQVAGPLIIITNAIGSFLGIIGFLFSPCSIIPPMLSLLILFPLGLGFIYIIVRLLRGGG